MRPYLFLLLAGAFASWAAPSRAAGLEVQLKPAPTVPASPQMGDRISLTSEVRNTTSGPRDGLLAWLSIVRVDKGHEAPISLEDWSAEEAVVIPPVPPGQSVRTDWPMRLIAAGHYRAVVSVATPQGPAPVSSPFADITVRAKPVVESARVLPVATLIPIGFLGLLGWRRWRA